MDFRLKFTEGSQKLQNQNKNETACTLFITGCRPFRLLYSTCLSFEVPPKEAAVLQRRLIHRLRHYKCRNDIQQQAGAPNKAQQRRGNANHRGVPPHIFCQTAAHTGQHFVVPLAKTLLVHTKSSLWFCDSFRHRRRWNSA